ncbi:MAG TPA: ribosome maturation factor RimM [Acidimicrobiales bacterium]
MAARPRPSARWSTSPAPRTAWRPASTSSTTRSTPPPDLLKIGRVTKAHGLHGEVVVQLWTDLTERLDPGSVLTTPRGTLTVEHARPFQDRWIVQFEGIVDRSQAENMRGIELEAEAVEVPGKLWVHELVGALVVDVAGTELGTVSAVEPNPASDLLVLEDGGLIPLRFVVEGGGEGDAGSRGGSTPGTLVVDIPEGLLDLG